MKLGSAGTNAGSLNVYNTTNTDYLQIATTANMSTISTNGTGVRQLALVAQSTNIYNALVTAPISVRDANLSSIYIALNATGINLTYGLNYQINGIEYLATKSTTNLIEGTNLYYTDSRFDTRFNAKTTNDLIQGTTNKYLNALTTTSPNEITLTLSANNLSGSLNLYNATNTDYLQITTSTGMSTISTNGTGVRQLALFAQTTNIYNALITAPISVRDAATMSSIYMVLNDTGINLTSGLNYKINGIEYLATKSTTNLIEGTNKYLNSLTTTSPNEITLTLATNNLSAQLKDTSIALSKLTSGGAFQMILCNGSGVPTYSSLTLNNLPYG